MTDRRREFTSLLDPWPAAALHASLGYDGDAPDFSLPMLWHWLYFLETPRRDRQGADGHPRQGGPRQGGPRHGEFFPEIAQPRRMFVGGRCRLHRKLQLKTAASVEERIVGIEEKQGRAGTMTLLTVGYRYHQRDALCIEEERDFMYLPARDGRAEALHRGEYAPIADAALCLDLATDPVLLFKFSALTFNGHRIHYDADYARDIEGYPATVVHGPLTALLLASLAGQSSPDLSRFAFRARAPLYCGDRLRLRGDRRGDDISLTAYRPDGSVAMTAEART